MSGVSEPDYSAQLWYGPPRRSRSEDGESRPPDILVGTVEVPVRLFGILAGLTPENPITLSLPAPVTAGDVVAAVQEQCGPAMFAHPARRIGETSPSCRLFLAGEPIEDFGARLEAEGGAPLDVELILVLAYEGG